MLQRYMNIKPPGDNDDERFRILGYQWRVLRFNDDTRQSAVKILAAYRESDPYSVCFMQQAHCLAVPCKVLLPFSHLKNTCLLCTYRSLIFYVIMLLIGLTFPKTTICIMLLFYDFIDVALVKLF